MRAYFHAAAIAGLDLRHVARWVSGIRTEEPEAILISAPGAAQHLAGQLTEMSGEANKTISTVRMTMSRSLAFLADPALAAAALPRPGKSLDIAEFLQERGTLYLIAETRGDDAPVAPLFACLASEVHHIAGLLGSRSSAGRLDPPLLMALDEVTQICPVPVPSWLADSGGRDIQIITFAHGEAQLRSRLGRRWRPRHHGHLGRQTLAARYLRPSHPRDRICALRVSGAKGGARLDLAAPPP